MLTFLILGIIVICCHSFTKLTDAGEKCIAYLLLNFYFALYLYIYSFTHPISFARGFGQPDKQLHEQPLQ
jgi:hypothetical protein